MDWKNGGSGVGSGVLEGWEKEAGTARIGRVRGPVRSANPGSYLSACAPETQPEVRSMPQYELEDVGPASFTGRQRGRSPEEAVRQAADLPDDAPLEVEPEADLQGWQAVRIDGAPSGRVRLHQRMRFRRD